LTMFKISAIPIKAITADERILFFLLFDSLNCTPASINRSASYEK